MSRILLRLSRLSRRRLGLRQLHGPHCFVLSDPNLSHLIRRIHWFLLRLRRLLFLLDRLVH